MLQDRRGLDVILFTAVCHVRPRLWLSVAQDWEYVIASLPADPRPGPRAVASAQWAVTQCCTVISVKQAGLAICNCLQCTEYSMA